MNIPFYIKVFLVLIILPLKAFAQDDSSFKYFEFVKDSTDFGEPIFVKETDVI